jgi:hypothetical protein
LPVYLTSFIGRTQELADIRALLATTRLFTLPGPGGGSKTRRGRCFPRTWIEAQEAAKSALSSRPICSPYAPGNS